MRARIAVALIAALAAPQLASARPAMIRVFEADVRPAPPPLAPPAQKPDLHPRLYVEDAGQLPRLMGTDRRFAADAESLANRRKASFVVGGLGVATAIALTFAGASAMSSQNPGDPNFNASAGSNLILAGMATFAVGMTAASLVYPHRGEVLDLLNGWNIAHPEQPLDLPPVVLVAIAGGPPVVGIPVGGDLYQPVTGGPPVVGIPTGP